MKLKVLAVAAVLMVPLALTNAQDDGPGNSSGQGQAQTSPGQTGQVQGEGRTTCGAQGIQDPTGQGAARHEGRGVAFQDTCTDD